METKSRYEAQLDLQAQKRQLIEAKFALKAEKARKEKEILLEQRKLGDMEAELRQFVDEMPDKEAHFDALIQAVDEGIRVFAEQINAQKKQ